MATTDDSEAIAAMLVVAVESGLLTSEAAVRVLDRDAVPNSAAPAKWLIDASLAREPQDVLHALREGAGEHPILSDACTRLEAIGRAYASGMAPMDVAAKVNHFYQDSEWPAELGQALYEVYEESTCGHAHGGPKPAYVEQALRVLFKASAGRSAWAVLLDRVAE